MNPIYWVIIIFVLIMAVLIALLFVVLNKGMPRRRRRRSSNRKIVTPSGNPFVPRSRKTEGIVYTYDTLNFSNASEVFLWDGGNVSAHKLPAPSAGKCYPIIHWGYKFDADGKRYPCLTVVDYDEASSSAFHAQPTYEVVYEIESNVTFGTCSVTILP